MDDRLNILIVDDMKVNLAKINVILSKEYAISMATNGREALEIVLRHPPDLILLDIIMPEMDGYEVCRRLKADETTRDIPVIFISSLDETCDEEKGLDLGAVDYITKPISPPIVKARVRNHLQLKMQQDQLKKSISLMEHEAEILAHKAELGLMAGGLAHDIANLVTPMMLIEFIPEMLPDDLPVRREIQREVDYIKEGMKLCKEVCDGYTSYLKNIGLDAGIQDVAPLLQPLDMYARRFIGKIERHVADDLPPILAKGSQLKRVFVNLFVNACQASGDNKDGKIILRLWSENKRIFFSIEDNGQGIPDSVLPYIFDESFTTRPERTGLGLYFARQIVDGHQGTMEVSSRLGSGTVFLLSFPAL